MRVHKNGGILVQATLENWTDIDYFAARYLDKVLYERKDLGGQIEEFMKDDPARGALVAKKIGDWMAYRAEQTRLGIKDPADDAIGETQLEEEAGTSSKIGQFLLKLVLREVPQSSFWLEHPISSRNVLSDIPTRAK